MEGSLHDLLVKSGVNSSTIDILESEMIVTKEIFFSLGDSHFQHILPKLKVGQLALLLNIWQKVSFLVSPHFMRGRELSTLVVILSVCHSVIMGSHFQVIKHEHRVLYSH